MREGETEKPEGGRERGSTSLTCDAAAPNGEEGQFKPPSSFTGPCWQDELICVLENTHRLTSIILVDLIVGMSQINSTCPFIE